MTQLLLAALKIYLLMKEAVVKQTKSGETRSFYAWLILVEIYPPNFATLRTNELSKQEILIFLLN
jgi:hypothetical protein